MTMNWTEMSYYKYESHTIQERLYIEQLIETEIEEQIFKQVTGTMLNGKRVRIIKQED